MTPEQEIRAEAIKAAAALCAPVSGAVDGNIPAIEDVLFTADVFYGYIQGEWPEALRVHATSGKQQEQPSVRKVELREPAPVEDILLSELEEQPAPPPVKKGSPEVAVATEERRVAEVIPIEARGVVTKEQNKARSYLDRIKRERAEQIFRQSQVAKTAEHKQRLLDEADDAGLGKFVLDIKGRPQELGSYLASL